jgi:hypothetical protein
MTTITTVPSAFPYSVYVQGLYRLERALKPTADFAHALQVFNALQAQGFSVRLYDDNIVTPENDTGLRFKA